MPFVSQDQRIQRQLLAEAATGPFRPVSYDPDTKDKTVDLVTAVTPAEAIASEMTTSFGEPQRNRRAGRQERQSWVWNLACNFTQEVSIEEFQKRLIAAYIILPRDATNDLEQVTLKLLSSDPLHPPQQNPSVGTKVTFVFEAELSPV